MHSLVGSPQPVDSGADAFVAELVRLEGELREVSQRLDRLEEQALHALSNATRKYFEWHR